jgi:hypothetical protein
MPDQELQDRMDAVERLTNLFRMERMVHLIVTTVSLVMLFTSAARLILKGEAHTPELGLLFGSSGLITYSASRLLTMWNQALSLVAPGLKGAAAGGQS